MVLKAINSTAVGKFVFNSKNELVCVSKKGDINKHSMVFQEMLLAGIKSDVPILIKKSDLAYNTETKEHENVSDYGEGATFSEESLLEYENGGKVIQKSSSKIYFTGRNEIVKDNQNRDMVMTPSDIIVHELVGHAIPFATESCTGDALLNENLVRLQCGKRQRHLMDLESESEAKKKNQISTMIQLKVLSRFFLFILIMMSFNLKTDPDNEMEITGKWKVCSFTAGTSYFSGGSRCPILEFFPKGNGVYNKDLRFNYLIHGDTLKIIPLKKNKKYFFL